MHGMLAAGHRGYGKGSLALGNALIAAAGIAVAAIARRLHELDPDAASDMIRPPASASLSDKERKEAVDELAKKRDTHEQDAQQQIEQSR